MTIHEKRKEAAIIANRLVKELHNRKEAFKKAWDIVKTVANGIITKVSGVTQERRQEALRRLRKYSLDDIKVNLIKENGSVVVYVSVFKGSYKLGTLKADAAAIVSPILEAGIKVNVIMKDIREKYNTIGAELKII